jgi:hypothetical protein
LSVSYQVRHFGTRNPIANEQSNTSANGADTPTPERKQPWLDTLREWAEQGRHRRRVRIIHDPITDYERYACEWGYALNSPAGEIGTESGTAFITDPVEVAAYDRRFAELEQVAVFGDEAARVFGRVAGDYHNLA